MRKEFLIEDGIEILLIIAVVFLVYYPSLFNFFKSDDFVWLYSGFVATQYPSNILTLDYTYFRPIQHILFAGLYNIFGLNPIGYHFLVLFLHSLTSVLVYYISRKFTDNKYISFIASIIFATLGIHFDSVLWVSSGFGNTFSTFLSLLSFISFVKWDREKKGRKYIILSLVFFVVNLFLYEGSIVLPAIIYFYLIIFSKKLNLVLFLKTFQKISYYLIILVPFLIFQYFIQKSGFLISNGLYSFSTLIFKNLLDFSVSLFTIYPLLSLNYLSRINAPKIIYDVISISSSILYIILPLLALYIFVKGAKNGKFFLLWFLITISPFLPFNTPLFYETTPLAAWHLYGAAIGFSILVGIFSFKLYENLSKIFKQPIAKFIVVFLLSIFVTTNIIVINLVEKYKYSDANEEIMVKFLKATHTSFPNGSKLFFVNDTMPFREPISEMIMSVYYPEGDLVPHIITIPANRVILNYTIYYSNYYEIYEISRLQLNDVPKGNNSYIFDYVNGEGIELH